MAPKSRVSSKTFSRSMTFCMVAQICHMYFVQINMKNIPDW